MLTKIKQDASVVVPKERTLPVLRKAVQECRGCDHYRFATQAVFGEVEAGPSEAEPKVSIMVIGEQPGDSEDKEGRPFVGPAGKLLDRCLEEAGIDRRNVYVTNTVKHFKWEPRGKRRLHAKPNSQEIAACRAWLDAELELVRPRVIACLGATAAQTLLGRDFRITKRHGEVISGPLGNVVATYHPSAVLRAPDAATRQQMKQVLIDDLRVVARLI